MINSVRQPSFRGLLIDKDGHHKHNGVNFDNAVLTGIINGITQSDFDKDGNLVVNLLDHISCIVKASVDNKGQKAQIELSNIKYKDISNGDSFELSNLSDADKQRTYFNQSSDSLLFEAASLILEKIKSLQAPKLAA